MQGWKLLTVRLSGTDKNSGGQVNILGTFPKEMLTLRRNANILPYIWPSRGQAKNNGRQVDFLDTFPQKKQDFSMISIPAFRGAPPPRILIHI